MRSDPSLQIINEFAIAMLRGQTLDDLLWNMVEQIGQLLSLNDCVIYLVEGEMLVQAAAFGIKSPKCRSIVQPIAIPFGQGIVGTVASTGQAELVSNTRLDPRYIADHVAGGSEISVPIFFEDDLIAVLDSESVGVGAYTEADLKLFQAIANVAASRIGWLRSERSRLQAKEVHNVDRLESLGKLAGGIAHDFNNLLTVIGMHTSLALMEDEEDVEESKELVLQAIDRAQGLSRQLMAFARGGAPLREEVDPTLLLREAVAFIAVHSAIEVVVDVAPDLPAIWADSDQLAQVCHNLLLNAAQAMAFSGCIHVKATSTDGVGGRRIVISIEDEGPGVPIELQDRIFDPYFSTKGEGTGLGLATSYWILRRHEGDLRVTNAADGGAVFTLDLPALHVRTVRSSKEVDVVLPKLRVLVFDDDPGVALGIRRLLEREGHEAVVVMDGALVAPTWQRHQKAGTPFDAVLIDLVHSAGIGGIETLVRLRAVAPKASAVVMSGYTEDDAMTRFEAHGFQSRLPKPFRPEALWVALSEALHKRQGACSPKASP